MENVVLGARGGESYIIVMGKGRKIRSIKIGQETRLAVQKYMSHERPHTEHGYLFVAKNKTPLTMHGLEILLDDLGKRARLENVYPHRFRHTFAINQLLAGTPSLVLMVLMGHSTLEATKIYTRALTQIQVMQASVSVVDVHWKDVQPDQDGAIRKSLKKSKLRKKVEKKDEVKVLPQPDSPVVFRAKRNKDTREIYMQWHAFVYAWQERIGNIPVRTSQVRSSLFDVLPEAVRPREGEHPKGFCIG